MDCSLVLFLTWILWCRKNHLIYSVEAAKDIAEKYEEKFANEDSDKKKKGRLETADGTKPNVIGIMNEAFSDLSVINEFSTNEDYMPFIHSLTEKYHQRLSVYAGIRRRNK